MFVIANRKPAGKLLSELTDRKLNEQYVNSIVYFCLRQRVNIAVGVKLSFLGWALLV
jgi:hypothetical protein